MPNALKRMGEITFQSQRLQVDDPMEKQSILFANAYFNTPTHEVLKHSILNRVDSSDLTIDEALSLTNYAVDVFTDKRLIELIDNNVITVNHLLAINTEFAHDALYHSSIQALITEKKLDPLCLKAIQTPSTYEVILDSKVQAFIREGIKLTPGQINKMSDDTLMVLGYLGVKKLVSQNLLILDDGLALEANVRYCLQEEGIQKLVQNHFLTVSRYAQQNLKMRKLLLNPGVQALVMNELLTIEQLENLPLFTHGILKNPQVQLFVLNGVLTAAHLEEIKNQSVCFALASFHFREMVRRKFLTIDELLNLTQCSVKALMDRGVKELVQAKRLTIKQLIHLNEFSELLTNLGIQELVKDELIPIDQLRELTTFAREVIVNHGVQKLLKAKILTFAHLLAITSATLSDTLQNRSIQQSLSLGGISIEAILEGRHPLILINRRQSTHNNAVHSAVSRSATLLARRYQTMIDGKGLDEVIFRVISFVSGLVPTEINKCAKRSIHRLTHPHLAFTEPVSQVSMRQLIALVFLAIEDSTLRMGSLKDAIEQFIMGLYEIQREYNLTSDGVNQEGADKPACLGGAFNKFIEKLQGIHPDCEIQYLTKATCSLKLPKVVYEEAIRYLKMCANTDRAEKRLEFSQIMERVQAHGVGVIWDAIKENVAERQFEEFGSLFHAKMTRDFVSMIETGKTVMLSDLGERDPEYKALVNTAQDINLAHTTTSTQNMGLFAAGSKRKHSSEEAAERKSKSAQTGHAQYQL